MKKATKGRLVARYIPGKTSALTTHDPMVTLEFEVDGGGVLQLLVKECPNAREVYSSLCDQMGVHRGWSKPVMVP